MKTYHYLSAIAGFAVMAMAHWQENGLATGLAFLYGLSQVACGNYCGDLERKEMTGRCKQ